MVSDVNPTTEEIKANFKSDRPIMGSVADVVTLIQSSPFELLDHFPLPPGVWCNGFYTLMKEIIEESRGKYMDNPEALKILEQFAIDPATYRNNLNYYNNEFFRSLATLIII
jgi:hypothetical protein